MSVENTDESGISRRKLIHGLGAASAAGLAGCIGGSDNPDVPTQPADELGERVPEPILVEYWSNLGGVSTIMEDAGGVLMDNLSTALATKTDLVPVEFTSQVDNIIQDKRTHHLAFWYHTCTPDRLDPHEMTRRYAIDWAGGNGRANPAHYASCEYSNYAVAQAQAPDEGKREELVHNAHSTLSKDRASINLFPTVLTGVGHPDRVKLDGVGDGGIVSTNPYWVIKSQPVDGDYFSADINPTDVETTNFMVHDSSATVAIWSHLFFSTLTEYDENLELQPVLAEDYTIEDNGTRITASLRDATFHDGTEITAEDVKFTFKLMWDNPGSFPQGSSPDYESINALDDKTVEFNMVDPFPALVTREWPRWGILHSQSWKENGGAEDPDGYTPDPVIGSGPFEIVDLEFGSYIEAEPHDGHPVHSPSHGITLDVYRDETTAVEAFLSGELDILQNISPGSVDRIESDLPDAEVVQKEGFMPYTLYPQMVNPPSKFPEFREAVGMSLNRKLMTEVALRNAAGPQMYSTPLQDSHPFRPPEEKLTKLAPSETGDIEAARKALTDAGWGWDEDYNLRYPKDADMSALWPKGETPQPEDFDCITEDGEFQSTM